MLEFSTQLKEYRIRHNLTQADLVEKLSHFDPALETMNLVTLSRWERGITVPTVLKMYKTLKYFNMDLWTFIKCIHFTPNKTQEMLFSKGVDKLKGRHAFGAYSYSSYEQFEGAEFIEIPQIDKDLLERTNFVATYNMGSKETSISDELLSTMQMMQKQGQFTIIACQNIDSHEVYAHGGSIIFNSANLETIRKKLSANTFSLSDLAREGESPLSNETFSLYIIPLGLHSSSWFDFYLKTLVKQVQQHPYLDKLYLACSKRSFISIYKYLGFELSYVIRSHGNENRYMLSCSVDKLIANHGFIKYARTYL